MGPFTHGEVEAATIALVTELFESSDFPLSDDEWYRHYAIAGNVLEAANRFRADHASEIPAPGYGAHGGAVEIHDPCSLEQAAAPFFSQIR